jgi:hypothetical protein
MATCSDCDSLVSSDAEAIGRVSGRAARTRLVRILRIIEPGLAPKLTGGLHWVDAGILPPGSFIAHTVYQSMMDSTERHRELVARLATQGPRLQVA